MFRFATVIWGRRELAGDLAGDSAGDLAGANHVNARSVKGVGVDRVGDCGAEGGVRDRLGVLDELAHLNE